jgi:hypothetical protein
VTINGNHSSLREITQPSEILRGDPMWPSLSTSQEQMQKTSKREMQTWTCMPMMWYWPQHDHRTYRLSIK